jgi:anti-sigma B factor antagonist
MEIRGGILLGVPLLAVNGDIDHFTALELEKAVLKALPPDGSRLIVDLTSCSYIDSGGLAVLLHVVRRVRSGGWLAVVGANHNVRRLFEILGLLHEPGFRVLGGLDEAAALVGNAA